MSPLALRYLILLSLRIKLVNVNVKRDVYIWVSLLIAKSDNIVNIYIKGFHYYQNKRPNINKAFVRERKRGIWGAATIIMLASHHHQATETPYGHFFFFFLLIFEMNSLLTKFYNNYDIIYIYNILQNHFI